jgi:TusA-related sulfurtransferase
MREKLKKINKGEIIEIKEEKGQVEKIREKYEKKMNLLMEHI